MSRKIMPRLSYLLPALPVVLVHKYCLPKCQLECLPKGQLEPIPIPLNMFDVDVGPIKYRTVYFSPSHLICLYDVYVGPIKYRTLNQANFILMLGADSPNHPMLV